MTRLRSSRRSLCCYGIEPEAKTVLQEEATTELVKIEDVQRKSYHFFLARIPGRE